MSDAVQPLTHQVREARSEKPDGAIVLLHGRGTDEFDLLPVLDELDPDRRLVGLTARAPMELSPGGFHWYISRAVGYPDPETFLQTYARVSQWLDGLPELLGVPWSRTVLGGFSMGAVMSYALGLGAGRPAPAGILALSGFIPTVPGFELDLSNRAGFPVAIGHGIGDPVISVDFARAARERLQDAGASVLYRESRNVPRHRPGVRPRGAELADRDRRTRREYRMTESAARVARAQLRRVERDVRHAARPRPGARQAGGGAGPARAPAPARRAAAHRTRVGDAAAASAGRLRRVRRRA